MAPRGRPSTHDGPRARLGALGRHLAPAAAHTTLAGGGRDELGTLRLGPHVAIPVHRCEAPERIPPSRLLLDLEDPLVLEHLEFLGKKWQLHQDVFLSSPPGPYARRLCQTFAALVQVPVEYVSLHRDVGEAELLQARSLEAGGNLRYDDGPVVRAMKHGRILVLEGIERAERGVMPILNNILENREHHLPDGTQLVPAERLGAHAEQPGLVPVHPDFRVFCLGLPVPPYRGHPLDPPFRSRFQARWVEGAVYVAPPAAPTPLSEEQRAAASELARRWGEWAAILQIHGDFARGRGNLPATEQLPHLPSTAVPLLHEVVAAFPPAEPPRALEHAGAPQGSAVAHPTRRLLSTAYPALLELPRDKAGTLHELLARVALDRGVGDRQAPGVAAAHGAGLMGYRLVRVERRAADLAAATFQHAETGAERVFDVPCGPHALQPVPALGEVRADGTIVSERVLGTLSTMLQLHTLGRDMCLVPWRPADAPPTQASASKATCIALFAAVLGYPVETVWLWKDVGGGELVMRRATTPDGATVWEPAPLTQGALDGTLVHLAGVDVLGPTLSSLARLTQDREMELWDAARLSLDTADAGTATDAAHRTVVGQRVNSLPRRFRLVASAPNASASWFSEDVATLFATLPALAMDEAEERALVAARTRCEPARLERLFEFARRYRAESADANVGLHKARRLGTRQLLRIAARLAHWPDSDVHALLWRNQLVDFLPRTVRELVADMLAQCGIVAHGTEGAVQYIPPLELQAPQVDAEKQELRFVDSGGRVRLAVPRYAWREVDPEGGVLVPNAHGSFHHNAQQTRLLHSFVQDLAVLGEHLLLMGAQGTGKNKLIDQALELLDRPREYVQLNRDSTVGELLQRVYLENGQLRYSDSPLVRALKLGRVLVVDEVDKAPASVSAVFKSLAERSELSLPDGRRVRPPSTPGDESDVLVHPDFRLVLLANRPGWPFLGNSFTEVIGEGFSAYAVANPDMDSEVALLQRIGPNVSSRTLHSLAAAFSDLRAAFEADLINHPYSLRELIHVVRHLDRYPDEPLGDVLLNVLAFDLHKPEAMQLVLETFARRGLRVGDISLEALRERAVAKSNQPPPRVEYEPKGDTSLDRPKEGKHDPENKPHVGGNTWRGGTGGRDTAGLGGRGGFERLFAGHEIHQIPEELKQDVPEHIRQQAREMADKALAAKLAEDGLDAEQEQQLLELKKRVAAQVQHLANVLNALTANEKERTWVMRQQEGQLDERRLSEGLAGERSIFKRRAEAPPEIGAPQMKPKRIRVVLDASASMYHMQFDGRLSRELETCLLIMEAMAKVDPERFVFDMVAHSGDRPMIPLIEAGRLPKTDGDRFRILRDIVSHTRFCFSGDYTVECLERSVKEVAEADADDYFVIALSDANLARYAITPEMLDKALKCRDKVKSALIFIDRGPEAIHAARKLHGRAFVASDTRDIPRIMSDILTSMVSSHA